MSDSEITDRVGDLSTKLIESIEAQSVMEMEIRHLRLLLSESKKTQDRISDLETKNESLSQENERNRIELTKQTTLKNTAEREAALLKTEMEDLSSSLFNEANNMVSTARKETNETQLKNDRLSRTLYEKDNMIESLLKEKSLLKGIIRDIEEDQKRSRRASQHSSVAGTPKLTQSIFSSSISADDDNSPPFRFEVTGFLDFKTFVSWLVKQLRINYGTLKDQSFFKCLLLEDVEPTLRLDQAPGLSIFTRSSFLTALVDGKVVIEPISGINEVWYQKKYFSEKLFTYPPGSPPVAKKESCALCGESRDGFLPHCRLHVLKIKKLGAGDVTYPLCSYCLWKVRRTCDMLAFIRNIANSRRTKVWNFDNEADYCKAWRVLSKLREKMFWARIGVWEGVEMKDNEPTTGLYDSYGEIEGEREGEIEGEVKRDVEGDVEGDVEEEAFQCGRESQGDQKDERVVFPDNSEYLNDKEIAQPDAVDADEGNNVIDKNVMQGDVETKGIDRMDGNGSFSAEIIDEQLHVAEAKIGETTKGDSSKELKEEGNKEAEKRETEIIEEKPDKLEINDVDKNKNIEEKELEDTEAEKFSTVHNDEQAGHIDTSAETIDSDRQATGEKQSINCEKEPSSNLSPEVSIDEFDDAQDHHS